MYDTCCLHSNFYLKCSENSGRNWRVTEANHCHAAKLPKHILGRLFKAKGRKFRQTYVLPVSPMLDAALHWRLAKMLVADFPLVFSMKLRLLLTVWTDYSGICSRLKPLTAERSLLVLLIAVLCFQVQTLLVMGFLKLDYVSFIIPLSALCGNHCRWCWNAENRRNQN